jgi:hypothetical protein
VQLVSVLRLGEDQLPEAERLHCLKLFTNLLSTQAGVIAYSALEAQQAAAAHLLSCRSRTVACLGCYSSSSSSSSTVGIQLEFNTV